MIKILEIGHYRWFLSEPLCAVLIEAPPTPLLPLIKILSLRKASLTPPKSKFRRCANSFNKIQPLLLPIVSIKILSLLQVVCDQNSIIADLMSKFHCCRLTSATTALSPPLPRQQQAPQSRTHRSRSQAAKAARKAQAHRRHCCVMTTTEPR